MTRSMFTRESPKMAMLRVLGATALALTLLVAVKSPAAAQSACASHAEVTLLGSVHSEAQVSIGLMRNGGVVEVFSTGDGASWTMVMTTTDGVSCVVASGEAWEQFEPAVLGPAA